MKRDKTVIWRGVLSSTLVALTLAFSSCTKEALFSSEQLDKEYIDFSLELTPPGAFTSVETRAMTSAQQNAINSAEVLIFQDNTLVYHETGTVTDIDGVKKQVQVKLKVSQRETDLYDIMVIGNPPSFDFAPYVTKTKEELKAAFNVSAIGKWSGSEFIMYGEALQTLVKPITNNFKIQMLRSLARLDIGVGAYNDATDSWAGLTDVFFLTEVLVVNSRNKIAVIPSETTINSSGNVMASAPTIPSGTVAQGTTAATAIKYFGSTDIADSTHTKSSIFLPEASNTTDRVTLLIGGSYKGGATTYYRVDMCVPKADEPGSYDYLNILRNHLYRISITEVSGAGFTDPQEALISAPVHITTTLTPIAEGDSMGEVVFDGSNYLMTDASSLLIYGNPNGVKTYPIATFKTNYPAGIAATITGFGITTSVQLAGGVTETISAAIPDGTTTGSYTLTVGKLTKIIPFTVQPPVDAHFDFLPFANVESIHIADPKPWLTLSQKITYVNSEQKASYIAGNGMGKAYFHFDENIATTGEPRIAQALVVKRNNSGSIRVCFEQLNLNGMVLGYFGGVKDSYGYTKLLAVESLEEYLKRVYDDTSIGTVTTGVQFGFNGVFTGSGRDFGKEETIAMVKRADNGIAGPYTIYNTYAARYCYDKNRDINGDGVISDDEIRWYLPAEKQLKSAWVAYNGVTKFSGNFYWSAMERSTTSSNTIRFDLGVAGISSKDVNIGVRCVRDI